jgi:hypothetical protein
MNIYYPGNEKSGYLTSLDSSIDDVSSNKATEKFSSSYFISFNVLFILLIVVYEKSTFFAS